MLLLIDIGNEKIKVKYETVKVINTRNNLTVDCLVDELGEYKFLGITEVEGVVISSVVPNLNNVFIQYSRDVLEIEPIIVSNENSHYEIFVKEPVGADILSAVNAVVGERIIVILSTATVIIYVADGLIKGATISPGLISGFKSLCSDNVLVNSELIEPKEILGNSTVECVSSGVIYGHLAMIEGLIDKMSPSDQAKIIATGEYALKVLKHSKRDILIDDELVFKGMTNIYKHLRG